MYTVIRRGLRNLVNYLTSHDPSRTLQDVRDFHEQFEDDYPRTAGEIQLTAVPDSFIETIVASQRLFGGGSKI